MAPITEALTFDDVTLAPSYSSILPSETITSTKWGISDSIAIKLFHELYSSKVTIS